MKCLLILLTSLAASKACSCIFPGTPKDAFCAADFVSHLKVISKQDPTGCPGASFNVKYTVRHIKVFRKSSKVKQLSTVLETSTSSCGLMLTVGREYLIAGNIGEDGALSGHQCATNMNWADVQQQERDLLSTYKC
ncbi:unnamed protein product [Nippostrongylus brasiliensis]|uniref:NTR domain-containing protein n=1 Tax=Nippostrongylus brasiliensis TaxID=27835 RepID=A0A0N4YB86_NIPBR|nr:unnamed protein product [Nippostrongylus brasiliensis]